MFGIRSTPHTISTPNAIAVVQYLDPETNEIVVENHPIGGFGNSIISIDTGVPIGSPLSVGEVKIGITNSSVLQNATGAGLIARALGRLVGGITGTDSIRESSQFLVFLQSIANTHDDLHSKLPVPTPSPKECFASDTLISMWPLGSDFEQNADAGGGYCERQVLEGVWQKPIEQIVPGDVVVSFD